MRIIHLTIIDPVNHTSLTQEAQFEDHDTQAWDKMLKPHGIDQTSVKGSLTTNLGYEVPQMKQYNILAGCVVDTSKLVVLVDHLI